MSDIKEKMIPEGAEDEAAELIYQKAGVLSMEDARDLARAAILAALNAWPGAFRNDMEEAAGVRRRIILPLPQEKQP